jgi:AraC-like DNA-binding protein
VHAVGPIDGVELLRARFTGRAYSRHRHDTYAIGVTELGVQSFDYRGSVETCRPGQVFVLHPDETHDGRDGAHNGFGYCTVYVEPARIAAAARAITGCPTALPFVREPVSNDPTLARAVASAFASALEPLALDTLMVRLAEGLLEGDRSAASAAAPRVLDQAALARGRAYLDSRQEIVRSAELEAITGLSRFELARQFRVAYGTSPHRYSLMRRLDFARTQLCSGVSLADLALSEGFADQAHFTRMFRAAYGVTPARYARLRSVASQSISSAG